jgi:peptidoglycan/LPS O-acetylase OafA/YrhL
MTIPIIMKKPSAFLPIAMSLAALAVIFIHIALHGTAPQTDEGTAAHLWQFLIIVFFAIRWLPQSSKHALTILALQVVAAVAALAPVFLLHW